MQNSYIFIQEHSFENVLCETAAILSWPQCVKLPLKLRHGEVFTYCYFMWMQFFIHAPISSWFSYPPSVREASRGVIETFQWHHNECDCVSNHQHPECLLNRLFRSRSKKTSKLHVTGLFEANQPVTGRFPSQRASNMKNVIMTL